MLRVIENYATLSELTKALANRCAQTVPRRSPDGPQTVPRRSPAEKHTVPDHFKIHKGRFPNPFLIILKWSGTVCFFAGDRPGTVWGPSGHRCLLEFRNIYACMITNSQSVHRGVKTASSRRTNSLKILHISHQPSLARDDDNMADAF